MARRRAARPSGPLWSVPIAAADIPDIGRRFAFAADEATRAAVAEAVGVLALPELELVADLTRHGRDGVRAVGRVAARVEQTCVVTLDPVQNTIDEPFDLIFAPEGATPSGLEAAAELGDDPPEVLRDGTVDLGAVAVEFLVLGIDPYPRKPGARFDAPAEPDDGGHPFAALAALKKRS